MFNQFDFIALILALFIEAAIPFVALIWLKVKGQKINWLALAVGNLVFFVFVILFENQLNNWLGSILPSQPQLRMLYIAFLAAIVEETGRIGGLWFVKWRTRRKATISQPVSYGIGHGGLELYILGVVPTLISLITAIGINQYGMSSFLRSVPASFKPIFQQTINTMMKVTTHIYYVGMWERVMTFAVQIALSILIWLVITKRLNTWLYMLAYGLHFIYDLGAAAYQVGMIKALPMEIWLTIWAIIICVLIGVLRKNSFDRSA